MGLVRRSATEQADTVRSEPPGPDELVRLLDDPVAERRREAALYLDGVEAAVPALLDRVGEESDLAVRDAVLTTVAAHDTDAVATSLARHLGSDDAGLRTAVAEALSTMHGSVPALLPRLVTALDHRVRIMTVMVLADLHHPEAPAWLAAMIREDAHPNVVAAAIDALLPSARAKDAALLQQARDRFPQDPFLRFTVEAAIPVLVRSPR